MPDRRVSDKSPDQPDPAGPPLRDHWRFKREVTSGDIILAIALAGPMLWYVAKLDTRVQNLEDKHVAQQVMQARIDAAQDAVTKDALNRIDTSLRDIQQFLLQS